MNSRFYRALDEATAPSVTTAAQRRTRGRDADR